MDELRISGADRAVLTAAAAERVPAPPAQSTERTSKDRKTIVEERSEAKAEQAPQISAPAKDSPPPLLQSNARIRLDETLNRPIVQIMDQENRVIKQYPPEALVQFSVKFREIQGLIFDKSG